MQNYQNKNQESRPVILCFLTYYLPGYKSGGPLRTITNFVECFREEFDVYIVTSDRDVQDNEPYSGISFGTWNQVRGAKVFYVAVSPLTLMTVVRLLRSTQYDVLYVNSFFSPFFTVIPLLLRKLGLVRNKPCVIAPRGEFSAGALLFKSTKKKIYMTMAKVIGLYKNLWWQASSGHEKMDIERALSYVKSENISIARDLAIVKLDVDFQPFVQCHKSEARLRICFLSRITPIKNLDFALRALVRVDADVVFTIYGPKEHNTYWERCEAIILSLPPNVSVVYGGAVHPSDVTSKLAQHDLFLLPTKGENYGHVIHEALMSGLPVLLSDQTPWSDLESRGVGWAISLDDEIEFSRRIDEVAKWSQSHMARVRHAAVRYATELALDGEVLNSNKALFYRAISEAKSAQ
jgi:glycosyltransferase involved in cell wall biosynthesis